MTDKRGGRAYGAEMKYPDGNMQSGGQPGTNWGQGQGQGRRFNSGPRPQYGNNYHANRGRIRPGFIPSSDGQHVNQPGTNWGQGQGQGRRFNSGPRPQYGNRGGIRPGFIPSSDGQHVSQPEMSIDERTKGEVKAILKPNIYSRPKQDLHETMAEAPT